MNFQLKQKRVLVSGSSRGIGRGIAEAFLSEKARVAVSGRERAVLKQTVSELREKHGEDEVLLCCGDLTSEPHIRRTLNRVRREWGGLDVLVLNLGSGRSRPGLVPAEEWRRVLELNLVAALEMLRLAADLLAKGRQPSVVFIGSIAGQEAVGAPIAYGAAKAGLQHAMKTAAQQLAPRGIRVNMVAPGNIMFPGGTWERKSDEAPEATATMLRSHVPLQRFGTVEEVGACAAFLASRQAAFVTGSCLNVDGGQTKT